MKKKNYVPDVLVLRDDEGNESELEILDTINFEGRRYVVLYPVDAEEDDPVIIMRTKSEEYFFVSDQRVIDGVYDLFLKRLPPEDDEE
ncbi:MAG: DUF1292 domain-containing protein [Clostridiales bacterium]|nr:DUF1292 domain-containing protein [Candidatus Blautia equi]